MWKPEQHSDGENLRWALLRAIEWKHWPLFLSQPVVPVLLYFYPWPWVVGVVTIAAFLWWIIIAPQFTPLTGVDLAVYFVCLRFLICPLMAYWIWQSGHPWIAGLALLWPFLGNRIVLWLLIFPEGLLGSTERAKAAQIGVIQTRLMSRLRRKADEAVVRVYSAARVGDLRLGDQESYRNRRLGDMSPLEALKSRKNPHSLACGITGWHGWIC